MVYQQFIFNSKINIDSYHDKLKLFRDQFVNNIPKCCDIDNILTEQDLELANYISNKFNNIIIVGIGGSILNPKMNLSIRDFNNQFPNKKNFYFIDFLDQQLLSQLMTSLDLTQTAVLFISKSGETLEIIFLFDLISEIYNQKKLALNEHLFAITDNVSTLGEKISKYKIKNVKHSENIGGRFSSFANVGMIPAIIAGLDYNKTITAARKSIESFVNKPFSHYATESAIFTIYSKPIIVLMGYFKNIIHYNEWYAQMIGESLGKYNDAVTPMVNSAPQDYHSQMQLYLAGPLNKSFSLYHRQGECEIINAQYQAFKQMLNNNSIPLKTIEFSNFNEESLGQLMINTILEIIISGFLLNINPYDQPGIQEIKNLTSQYLNQNLNITQ